MIEQMGSGNVIYLIMYCIFRLYCILSMRYCLASTTRLVKSLGSTKMSLCP